MHSSSSALLECRNGKVVQAVEDSRQDEGGDTI